MCPSEQSNENGFFGCANGGQSHMLRSVVVARVSPKSQDADYPRMCGHSRDLLAKQGLSSEVMLVIMLSVVQTPTLPHLHQYI